MAEKAHTGTEAAGAAHAGAFPPFARETFPSQLLWLAITFGVLYVLMSKVALPRVAAVLHKRAQTISGNLGEAQAMKAQSEAAGAAYETSLAQARDKAKAIAQQTRDALAAESDAKRKTLEAELGERLATAEATIRSRTAEAMSSVRGIAADAAAAIVERLTGQAPDQGTLEAAADRTLKA
jgi:F-type H+-transporting ATPase subunit b